MIKYLFLQNAHNGAKKYAKELNFLYHVNLFEWSVEHGHEDYWEFTIVTNGTINNYVKGKSAIYSENNVFVSTTESVHSLVAVDNAPVRYINIMVRSQFLISMLNAISPRLLDYIKSDGFSLTLSSQRISEIESILLRINYTDQQSWRDNDDLARSAFMLLLSEIILSRLPPPSATPSHLISLNLLIQNNELIHYNVNDLSSALGYSRIHLNALFKKNFGVSPHKYLINYKLRYAQKLLLSTNASISEIAYEIGYSTPMQFYTVFKKAFGMTPNQFRKSRHDNNLYLPPTIM